MTFSSGGSVVGSGPPSAPTQLGSVQSPPAIRSLGAVHFLFASLDQQPVGCEEVMLTFGKIHLKK